MNIIRILVSTILFINGSLFILAAELNDPTDIIKNISAKWKTTERVTQDTCDGNGFTYIEDGIILTSFNPRIRTTDNKPIKKYSFWISDNPYEKARETKFPDDYPTSIIPFMVEFNYSAGYFCIDGYEKEEMTHIPKIILIRAPNCLDKTIVIYDDRQEPESIELECN